MQGGVKMKYMQVQSKIQSFQQFKPFTCAFACQMEVVHAPWYVRTT